MAGTEPPARLRLEGLVVEVAPGVRAVDGVSIDVEAGEVVALLGPSGCGKTTLLRAVAGLVAPSAGRVSLDGVDLAGVPTHRRGIGLMFQDYALFPHHTVGGNVEFGLRMQGRARRDRAGRVDEVLELVGLPGYADRAIGSLSGGERQRVALARSLAPAPRVLMLDEPLGALDRTLRDRLLLELADLFAALALTVVYVTHDQAEALALARRLVVMRDGTVAQQGTPRHVWAHPVDRFVAGFLGLANLFDVTVGSGRARLPWGEDIEVGGSDGPASVVVRPEAITFVADGYPAVVDRTAFAGDHTLVRLRLEGVALEARSTASAVPAPGDQVRVAVDPTGVVRLGDGREGAAPIA